MDCSDHQHQAPEPQWISSVSDVSEQEMNTLRRRVSELEEQVRVYEANSSNGWNQCWNAIECWPVRVPS